MANTINHGPDITAKVYDIILLPLSWVGSTSPYTYTVSAINDVLPNSIIHILPSNAINTAEYTAYTNAKLIDGGIVNNTVTIRAVGVKPTVNIPVRIIVSQSIFVESKYELSTYPVASQSEAGLLRLATNAEVNAGMSATTAVSPSSLYNHYLKLTGGTLTGQLNCTTITATTFNGNATTASKLAVAKNISLYGGVSGNVNFDGSGHVSINTTVTDNSHTHIGANITSKVSSATLSDNTNAIAGVSVYTGTTNPTSATRVNVQGYLYATRMYNAVYNDYAECFDTTIHYDDCKNRIVKLKDGKIYLADNKSDDVIGVVSDTYGFILYGSEESIKDGSKVPVGMAGTLYVDAENDVSENDINKFVISGNDGKAKVIHKDKIVEHFEEYFGCIVGKVIGINEEKNQYKIIISLQ